MSAAIPTIGFVSLGCPKALVDSERIMTRLRAEGYGFVNSHEKADVVIVNTCGFIDSAIEESLDAIGEAMEKNGQVIVTGCLGARAALIKAHFPNLLAITGPQAYETVVDAVHRALPPPQDPFVSLIPPQGIKLTPRHYAYLKISEGCNHKCTFCIIPSLRGKLVSRPIDQVLNEAERLVNAGVKELLVISQDTSAYGIDLKYQIGLWHNKALQSRFYDLINALGDLNIWIRLHYVYPYPHVDAVIPLMAAGKILPYLDIPFQHANARILKQMKRPASGQDNLERIHQWRAVCPTLTLRSTFIVGFPGETEAEFNELLDFLHEARLERAGCFQYSPVAGAAANTLADPIPEAIKEERYHRFMTTQAAISQSIQAKRLGKPIEVIVDAVTEAGVVGRSHADAPEIDGVIYVTQTGHCQVGDIITVRVTGHDQYDLHGERIVPKD
jgi:ribosomal protein S12 methylthiotransferase